MDIALFSPTKNRIYKHGLDVGTYVIFAIIPKNTNARHTRFLEDVIG